MGESKESLEAKTLLERLEGRILALELLMRGILTASILENNPCDEQLAYALKLRTTFLESLQNLKRPKSESADRVWEASNEALQRMFDQVELRIKSMK